MLSEVADETISSRLINGLVPRKRVRRSLQWVFRFQWGRNPPFSPQAGVKIYRWANNLFVGNASETLAAGRVFALRMR